VGQLAAGIAHEINTPIQFIGDSAHFVNDACTELIGLLALYRAACSKTDGSLPQELQEAEEHADLAYLQEQVPRACARTLEGVDRVATIVRALKEFAHPNQKEQAPADLNRALLSTLTVARNEYKYVAEVETDLGEIPAVVCNVGDLNQVFLNLIVNAAHAIHDVVRGTEGRGLIRVTSRQEGEQVVVAISDSGSGIPEHIRERIFEPFFTTKEVGRGTGQGLAIARSIVVDRHGGSLTFDSEPGRGTTFYIRLPIAGRDTRGNDSEANRIH
jgi:signal transduction histidine kinase